MTDQNNAAQAAEQPLPSYGKLPFDQLGRDVTEATMGVRQPFDFGPNYPGHAMCLINFNSLARIVDKYCLPVASAPLVGEAVATIRGAPGESWKGDAIIDLRPGLALTAGTELFLAHAAPRASEAVHNALAELITECERADAQAQQEVQRGFVHPHIVSRARAALKTQADKDGAVCSCPTGDGSLRHPCDVHPPARRDCAKGAAQRLHGLVEEAISWLETGGGRADSLCADLRKALAAQKHPRTDGGGCE